MKTVRIGTAVLVIGALHASCGGASDGGGPGVSGGMTAVGARAGSSSSTAGQGGTAGRGGAGAALAGGAGETEHPASDAGAAGDDGSHAGGHAGSSSPGHGGTTGAGGMSGAGEGGEGASPNEKGGAAGDGGVAGAAGASSNAECRDVVDGANCEYWGDVCVYATSACVCDLAGFTVWRPPGSSVDIDIDYYEWDCLPLGCPATEPTPTATSIVPCTTITDADVECHYGETRACTCPASYGAVEHWYCYDTIECPESAPAAGDPCIPDTVSGANNLCRWGTTSCSCWFDQGASGPAHWTCPSD